MAEKNPAVDQERQPRSSLLDPEARGGDTAGAGFAFQAAVTLAMLPTWLANDGFSQLICEGMGDIEVQYFVPGSKCAIELFEAKNYTLRPSDFWNEVSRCQTLAHEYPGVYERFILVAPSLSPELDSIVKSLNRIRNPISFYKSSDSINHTSFEQWQKMITGRGHSVEDAAFVFDKIEVNIGLVGAGDGGEALFSQSLKKLFPNYDNLPAKIIGESYRDLAELVSSRRNAPITRKELELRLQSRLPEQAHSALPPVRLHTCIEDPPEGSARDIRFDWSELFGGEARTYPEPEVWNTRVVGELEEARCWIQTHRLTRRIHLAGNRRLSAALAIGAVFSAVAGFTIEMEYRGQIWATDDYPTRNDDNYLFDYDPLKCRAERLVVSIGILRPIAEEVDASLSHLGLAGVPVLHLHGTMPIQSPHHANTAVAEIKRLIKDALVTTGAQQIDLFFAGPSHLAVFLGHRLNATAPVQCYEWVSAGRYVRTCALFD